MKDLFKTCIHHGELKVEQIYISPSGKKECRICKKQRRAKECYNRIKKFNDLRLWENPKLTCKIHGVLPENQIYICHALGQLSCHICRKINAKNHRKPLKEKEGNEIYCSKCKVKKSKCSFSAYDLKLKYSYCIECRASFFGYKDTRIRNHLKRKFNMTLEEYIEIYERQKGLCAICLQPESAVKRKGFPELKILSVDHNHSTTKNRELLCHGCNVSLGLIKENYQTALNMAKYIMKHMTVDDRAKTYLIDKGDGRIYQRTIGTVI